MCGVPRLPQGPWLGLGVEEEPQLAPPNSLLSPRLQFRVKKEGWGGGSTRNVTFSRGTGDLAVLKAGGRALTVSIGDGLPKSTSKYAGSRGGHRGGETRWGVVDEDQSTLCEWS